MNKRKNALTSIFLILLVFLFGCRLTDMFKSNVNSTNNQNNNVSTESSQSKENQLGIIPSKCNVSYYPVGPNIVREYHLDYQKGGIPDQNYIESFTDFKDDGFVGKSEFKDVTSTVNWICKDDGLITTQFSSAVDVKGGTGAIIETIKSEGISFPVDSKWVKGEKWSAKYEIKETIKNPKGQQVGVGNGDVTVDNEIIGDEQIRVQAGDFATIKVKNLITLNLTVKVSGITVPTKTLVDTTSWFAKDVGLVKSESRLGGAITATTELVSIKK